MPPRMLGNALALILGACLSLEGCGGGSGGSSVQDYGLNASVTGLTTSGLVLSFNGQTMSVPANTTTLQLSKSMASGASYQVTVATQPLGFNCTISNGSGTITNVSNVAVA